MDLHDLIKEHSRLEKEYEGGKISITKYIEERNRVSKEIASLKNEGINKLKREKFKLIRELREYGRKTGEGDYELIEKQKRIRNKIGRIEDEIKKIVEIGKPHEKQLKNKFLLFLALSAVLFIVFSGSAVIKPKVNEKENIVQKYADALIESMPESLKSSGTLGISLFLLALFFVLSFISSTVIWISSSLAGLKDASFSNSLKTTLAIVFVYISVMVFFMVVIISGMTGISGLEETETIGDYKMKILNFMGLVNFIELIILMAVEILVIKSIFQTTWKKSFLTFLINILIWFILLYIFVTI